ncbi:MAG TPA: ABC transporter ATP-binding protein [Caldisericia bacterium]|nr:ABC transporter ATP-binding protein [Caldisericia bacterium]
MIPDESWQPEKAQLSILTSLLPYLKKHRSLIFLAGTCLLLSTILSSVQPLILRTAIDQYILKNNYPGLVRISMIFLVFVISSFFLNYAGTYTSFLLAQRTIIDIRNDIFRKLLTLSVSFLGKTPLGVLITRTTNDTENLNELMSSGALQLINNIILLLSTIAFLLYLNWKLTLISLFLLPVVIVLIVVFSKMLRQAYLVSRNNLTRINIYLQENLSGVSLIKIFGRKTKNTDIFKKIATEYRISVYNALRKDILFNQLINMSSYLSRVAVIMFGGYMVIRGDATIGTIPAFLAYLEHFYQPLRDLGERFNIIQDAAASMTKISSILNNTDTVPELDTPSQNPIEGKISFEAVSFKYDTQRVLDKVSFNIAKGEKIAIVGPTGAGKSTIMNLLLRFYDVEEGKILVDGVDIRNYELKHLRSNMAIVLQDVFIFKETIRNNITLGNPSISDETIVKAAQYLNAYDFIMNQSKGFETELSVEGSNLSHGQKQLIAFVRTLVYNPKILLLDEATSSVDTQTEKLIQQGIEKLMQGRTSIVIAHRLSTIINSDRIFVIQKGALAEVGNHSELLRKKGLYYQLYTTQFAQNFTS